jgi:DNA-binding MarR family transcriptional regulator
MKTQSLSARESTIWHAFKESAQIVLGWVARDIAEATGLSEADFDVLSRLMGPDARDLRQQALAQSLGWHKARLSHHLSRMEHRDRDLVVRRTLSGRNVIVNITKHGRDAYTSARAVHGAGVRRSLLGQLTKHDIESVLAIYARLRALSRE